METFAKLSRTAIMRLDSQSAKLDLAMDSCLRGNDGRFCKGLLMGEESKARVKTRQSHQRVIPSKARNLKSPHHISPGTVILALRQYPQGGLTTRKPHHCVILSKARNLRTKPVIADLIRNPEEWWLGASFSQILDQVQHDGMESSDADLVHPQQDAHNNR